MGIIIREIGSNNQNRQQAVLYYYVCNNCIHEMELGVWTCGISLKVFMIQWRTAMTEVTAATAAAAEESDLKKCYGSGSQWFIHFLSHFLVNIFAHFGLSIFNNIEIESFKNAEREMRRQNSKNDQRILTPTRAFSLSFPSNFSN